VNRDKTGKNEADEMNLEVIPKPTIIQQYGDWYTGLGWMGCYIWYSEDGTGRVAASLSPSFATPNVTAHLSTAIAPTSYY